MIEPAPEIVRRSLLSRVRDGMVIGLGVALLGALLLLIWGPLELRRDFNDAFWVLALMVLLMTSGWNLVARWVVDRQLRRKS